jgi:hypothetical protein
MSADVTPFPGGRFERLRFDTAPPAAATDNLVVLPVIRREEACAAIALPSFAEQARAVGELAKIVSELLPKLPLIKFDEADELLRRLEAAEATLLRMAVMAEGT